MTGLPFPLSLLQKQCGRPPFGRPQMACTRVGWRWEPGWGSEVSCNDGGGGLGVLHAPACPDCRRQRELDVRVKDLYRRFGYTLDRPNLGPTEATAAVIDLAAAAEFLHPVYTADPFHVRSNALSLLTKFAHPAALPALGRLVEGLELGVVAGRAPGWAAAVRRGAVEVFAALDAIGTAEARGWFARGVVAVAHPVYREDDRYAADPLGAALLAELGPRRLLAGVVRWRGALAAVLRPVAADPAGLVRERFEALLGGVEPPAEAARVMWQQTQAQCDMLNHVIRRLEEGW